MRLPPPRPLFPAATAHMHSLLRTVQRRCVKERMLAPDVSADVTSRCRRIKADAKGTQLGGGEQSRQGGQEGGGGRGC